MAATLRHGVPQLGYGTFRVTDHDEAVAGVSEALEVGYRHVDTAEAYQNEEAVGEAIAASDVPYDDLFLATKVLHPKFTDSYATDDIVARGRDCLDRLGVDRVDLFYGIHWPNGEPPAYDEADVAAAMEQLADEGAFDHLGVCNLPPRLIDDFCDACDVPVAAVQVEMHPLLQQDELQAYCEGEDMTLVAYAPLANTNVLEVPELETVADKHDATTAQVSLAWLMAKGAAPIPKSTTSAHIRENWAALDLDLDDEDVATIDGIDREERFYQPDYSPNW